MSANKMNSDSWDFATAYGCIDGGTLSQDFLDLVQREKNGDITTDDMIRIIKSEAESIAEKECKLKRNNSLWLAHMFTRKQAR